MPSERFPQFANDFNKADLIEVFIALQAKVNRDLHVATLCIVESEQNAGIFRCSSFPRGQGKDSVIINALCIRASESSKLSAALSNGYHPIAIALMTDLDGQPNYDSMKVSQMKDIVESKSTLHSWNNAVIVYVGDDIINGIAYEDLDQGANT